MPSCFPKIHYRGSPTYIKITTMVSTTYHGFWLMYVQVGYFRVSREPLTVPLTQISCNTFFSKSQNVRKVGPYVGYFVGSESILPCAHQL